MLAVAVAAMCERFMLWFNTHDWKRSVNGMRHALTAESAGRRCQQVTLKFAFRPTVFDEARIQMHRSQLASEDGH